MPNKRGGKNRPGKSLADVTLNDFANASVCKNRVKKATSNVTNVLNIFEKEKTWDEKADEMDDSDTVAEIDEEGNVQFVKVFEPRRRRKTVSITEDPKENVGKDYPIDIWFLISEYIGPESVGRFAAICRTSFEVTCTAKFWYSLYRRYYKSVPMLPEKLQPECLVRKYCLRTYVIRALYYMYPPFINQLKFITVRREHPDILQKRLCHSHWFQKIKSKDQWLFYFKMRENVTKLPRYLKSTNNLPDLLEILDDVSANPDEHCCILRIDCNHFIQIPPVVGQVLKSVSITPSQGFLHDKIQLEFGTGISKVSTTTIVLDPVISYRVLNWWHPLYPHNNHIQDLIHHDL